MSNPAHDYDKRFGALRRLYGDRAYHQLKSLHICVVGLGGVGSWCVEALARSGIGKITLIDYDDVCISNINRQLPALQNTLGEKKFAVLTERVGQINPACQCVAIDDFVTLDNLSNLLNPEHAYDYVIDAIDGIRVKAAMASFCKRNKIPIIVTGGAGGLTDPTHVKVADLSKTYNDPLAAKVRATLRSNYGFSKNTKRSFGIECVFSSQQPVYPKEDGSVCHAKPGVSGVSLDCRLGYGSVSFVTGAFGFVATSRAINKALKRRLSKLDE
jgi:tRNA A37 threonylcarbamoyladenosine dehydratase